jgi:hypothetical protein
MVAFHKEFGVSPVVASESNFRNKNKEALIRAVGGGR